MLGYDREGLEDRQATVPVFDGVAATYDADFTDRRLGRHLRSSVWRVLARTWEAGDHVLDLGCGTGEDAVWMAERGIRVAATDASGAMLEVARTKVAASLLTSRVSLTSLDLARPLGQKALSGPFDGALSNFGALNCVDDLRPLGAWLSPRLRPGAKLVLVLIGRFCPWEIATFALRGRLPSALRRFRGRRPARVAQGSLPVSYPSPGRLLRELGPDFRARSHRGIGWLLPPSDLADLVDRYPRLFDALARWDSRFGASLPARWTCDHWILEVERL